MPLKTSTKPTVDAVSDQLVVEQAPHDQSVVVRYPASWLHIDRSNARRDLDQILGDNPRAVFAVDGTMFESTAGTDAFLLYDPSKGVNQPTRKPNEGMTISVVGGRAQGQYGGHMAQGATVAVQSWPSMVVDGRPVAHDTAANRERVWRLGIGADAHGGIVVVMLIGPMSALGERMAREGIINGGYLDGGSSLAADARGVFRRTHTAPSGVRIPGWILAVPPDGVRSEVVSHGSTEQAALVRHAMPPWVMPAAGAVAALLVIAVAYHFATAEDERYSGYRD